MQAARAGRYEQKFISQYFLADLWYTVYISVFGLNKVNVKHVGILIQRLNEIIFFAPLEDISACFNQKLTKVYIFLQKTRHRPGFTDRV